jgi:hypothetical protein
VTYRTPVTVSTHERRGSERWLVACLDVGVTGEADELGKPGLVDGGGDELAAEDDVGEEDGEVAAGLRVAALLVEDVPRDRHQVRALRLRRVVHLDPTRQPVPPPFSLSASADQTARRASAFPVGGRERGRL